MEQPDYRAFARDLMKLCKKHNIRIHAECYGFIGIGPAGLKTVSEYKYSDLEASPDRVQLGDDLIIER